MRSGEVPRHFAGTRAVGAIEQLRDWVFTAERCAAFTGAGISTESGIPDFRTPGGVWTRFRQIDYSEFVASREARVEYWKARMSMYGEFANAQPNAGHRALACLENLGRLQAVITQNIDGLHQIAGSTRVIELHGTARVIACIGCKRELAPEAVHSRIEAGELAPDCDQCGSPLKSKTISFGQMMPEREMREAAELAGSCNLFLAVGSSLVVEPAASIPRIAKQYGAKLVIVNREPTPLDYAADLVIHEPIGATLAAAVDRVAMVD